MEHCQSKLLQKLNGWLKNSLLGIGLLRCIQCNQVADLHVNLCLHCASTLPWMGHACLTCAIPLAKNSQNQCGQCLSHQTAGFEYACAAFEFKAPVSQWINQFKFHQQMIFARLLADCIVVQMQQNDQRLSWLSKETRLVALPLHTKRLRERGFNQAQLLANALGKRLQRPVERRLLQRIINTPHQIGLHKKERRKNVKNAFECRHSCDYPVLLVDDVMTTGASVDNAAKALKKAGAPSVSLALAARAV